MSSFEHHGAARRLVHLLKYGGVLVFADLTADLVCERVPPLPLVPVPRAVTRRLRYGVDPAREIALSISKRTGQPVIPALVPRLHTERRAGGRHRGAAARFGVRWKPDSEVVLVDDVVTTGATILEAVASLGRDHVRMAVVANSVTEVSSLSSS